MARRKRTSSQAGGYIFPTRGLEATRRELGAKIARAIDQLGPILAAALSEAEHSAFWRGIDAEMHGEALDDQAAAIVERLRTAPAINVLVLQAGSYHLCSSALALRERAEYATTKPDKTRHD